MSDYKVPDNKILVPWFITAAVFVVIVGYLSVVVPHNNVYGDFNDQNFGTCSLTKDTSGNPYYDCSGGLLSAKKRVVLNDVNHLSTEQWTEAVPNIIVYCCISISILTIIIANWKYPQRLGRLAHIFTTLITMIAIGMGLRLISISVTLVPHPPSNIDNDKATRCISKKHKKMKDWNWKLTKDMAQFNQICEDFMFSGHTFNSVIFAMFCILYGNKWIGAALFLAASFQMYALPRARMHYTSDTVIGFAYAVLLGIVSSHPFFGLR